jgi:hypothetical protein
MLFMVHFLPVRELAVGRLPFARLVIANVSESWTLPPMMRLGLIVILAFVGVVLAESVVPAPGSPDRRAIADAMRAFVTRDASKPLPKKLVFKIEFISVDGRYAGFEGYPIFEDGSDAIPEFMPDWVYCTVLERAGDGWRVIVDLTRTDVPSDEEVAALKKKLPKNLPPSVLTDYWRGLLTD